MQDPAFQRKKTHRSVEPDCCCNGSDFLSKASQPHSFTASQASGFQWQQAILHHTTCNACLNKALLQGLHQVVLVHCVPLEISPFAGPFACPFAGPLQGLLQALLQGFSLPIYSHLANFANSLSLSARTNPFVALAFLQ